MASSAGRKTDLAVLIQGKSAQQVPLTAAMNRTG